MEIKQQLVGQLIIFYEFYKMENRENSSNLEFINIAKDALRKGLDEKKIFKILRKEGLFDEESEKIIFQALEEIRLERLDNPDLENVKPKKDNRLFKWIIPEIIISIIAVSIFPFRIPPSKGLKKFSVFVVLAIMIWMVYSSITTKENQQSNSEKEFLQQLKILEQLQKNLQ